MEKTWRWFGRNDIITLDALRQIGVEGIVTALHEIPNGEVWSREAIRSLREEIEAHGMRWSVVESLPVCEEIKYAGPRRDALIANYRESLKHLGQEGVRTVCYNFMPVIDWTRTDFNYKLPDGTMALYFDYAKFDCFDICILKREGAYKDFPEEIGRKVREMDKTMTEQDKLELIDNIVIKTQGFVNGPLGEGENSPVERFKELMVPYKNVSKDQLRENLRYFLSSIMDVCDEYDINMCIHPDDPPMPIFGLPRIICNSEDIRWMLSCVDNVHNGLTFCGGSLSAGAHNNIIEMAREFVDRTHFVHVRSCDQLGGGNFVEAPHLGGQNDIVEFVRIFECCPRNIPMRVDHGKAMLGDENVAGYNPGYTFHGRMLALGQVSGIMAAVRKFCKKD